MACWLTIDSGGSKCEAALVSSDGHILRRAHCDWEDPAGGRCARGSGRAPETMATAVRRTLAGHDCTELCVAAAGAPPPGSIAGDAGCTIREVRTYSEQDVGFAGAAAEHGIVVLAGTGAFAFGRNGTGETLLMDGIGPVVADNGSGYHIGILALRATCRAGWHDRHATSMAADVRRHVLKWRPPRRPSLVALFVDPIPDRAEIASISNIVDQHARAGDVVAQRILHEAADAMATTVLDTASRLGLDGGGWPLIAQGSVARRSTIYWHRVCERVGQTIPTVRPVVPDLPAVLTLAFLGITATEDVDPQELRATLLAQVEGGG